jgi:hypothetical protein
MAVWEAAAISIVVCIREIQTEILFHITSGFFLIQNRYKNCTGLEATMVRQEVVLAK